MSIGAQYAIDDYGTHYLISLFSVKSLHYDFGCLCFLVHKSTHICKVFSGVEFFTTGYINSFSVYMKINASITLSL